MKPILDSRLEYSVLLVAALVLILTSGCSAEISSGRSELGDAAWQGDAAKVKTLLANGADVNFQDKFGDTALMRVSATGKMTMVKILLDHGADVNLEDGFGQTALDKASERGYERAVKLLKAAGAK